MSTKETKLAMQRERAKRYRAKNAEKVRAYKQRPEVKAAEAARMVRVRANLSDEDKARVRNETRRSHLRRNYGLTEAAYDAMLVAQNGVCAICKKPDTNKRWSGRLHVDHCHRTGAVRALLCTRCNITLGRIEESPELARAIIDYISKHQRVIQ